jgi:divinyl protochlorophyllide a 8-vinyl-reductase
MNHHHDGQIGPNAIIQTIHVLDEQYGSAERAALLERIGQAQWNAALPTSMIDETAFHALVRALADDPGPAQTAHILYQAGAHTADYLLAHRIPRPFQWLVQRLPRRTGMRLLLAAISMNAWTFVGSGTYQFTIHPDPRITVSVRSPTLTPVASFYGGTFERLLQVLIDPAIRIQTDVQTHADQLDCAYLVHHMS